MEMSPEGPAIITLREVYDLVLEIKSEVTLLKTTELTQDVSDHEKRIRALEKWIWGAAGAGAVGGAALSEVFTRMFNG